MGGMGGMGMGDDAMGDDFADSDDEGNKQSQNCFQFIHGVVQKIVYGLYICTCYAIKYEGSLLS